MTSVTTGAGPGDEERSVVRVQELLPHLNRPFILVSCVCACFVVLLNLCMKYIHTHTHTHTHIFQSCLKVYGYDAETVIHHVLEGSLPPHLQLVASLFMISYLHTHTVLHTPYISIVHTHTFIISVTLISSLETSCQVIRVMVKVRMM